MAKSRWEEVKEKLPLVEAWCRDGLVEEQIANNLGISMSTLSNYKVDHLEILDALKRGKQVVDIEVENALFKRATGYKYDEITREPEITVNEDGEIIRELKITKIVTKEVVADTTAQIFWLKNRKPKEWRDRKELEMSGSINDPFEGLTVDELRKLANK